MRATRRRLTRTCTRCGHDFSVVVDLEYPTLSYDALDVCQPCLEAEDDEAFETDDHDDDDAYA